VKTSLDLPAPLLRRAKARAAERGQSLEELVAEALQDKLARGTALASTSEPAWMQGFGKLRRLHRETERVQARIEGAFEAVEPDEPCERLPGMKVKQLLD
jgi:hypothetical protein